MLHHYELQDLLTHHTIYELLSESMQNPIVIRPSSINEFFDNSLSWAAKQILGVIFPSSPEAIIGSALHYAVELGFRRLKSGETFSLEDGLSAIALYIKEQWKFVEEESLTQEETINEAQRLFRIYYPLIPRQADSVLVAEERFEVPLDEERNIWVAGTVDRVEECDEGLCVVDIKTTKNAIYGEKAQEPKELIELKESLKKVQMDIKALKIKAPKHLLNQILLRKVVDRLKNLLAKNEEAVKNLQNNIKEAKKAKDEEFVQQMQEELKNKKALVSKLKRRLKNREELLNKLPQYEELKRVEQELQDKIAPLQEEVDRQQHLTDCEKAKERYGLQLAAYALLFEIATGKKVNRGKIELILRQKKAKLKIYEFDIEDLKIKVDRAIEQIMKVLKAFKDGVDPEILFRLNPNTFRGQELTKLLEEAEKEKFSGHEKNAKKEVA